mgnify:FL=1
MDVRIGVVGLGYVGLPVALAFAREFDSTVGFDISATRIKELRSGLDSTGEVGSQELLSSSLAVTDDIEELSSCNFFVIGVPTPIDKNHRPDLSALVSASQTVGSVIRAGSIVVYESTVYPGVTEDVCGTVLV